LVVKDGVRIQVFSPFPPPTFAFLSVEWEHCPPESVVINILNSLLLLFVSHNVISLLIRHSVAKIHILLKGALVL
jgi:hypothetical protein